MLFAAIVGIWLLLAVLVLIGFCRRSLVALWREPVLKRPVLILESDDWGAGPFEQAERIERIAGVLGRYADHEGRKPVMTLGLILGVADGPKIAADGLCSYYRRSLADAELAPIVAAIRRGDQRGVFALQLHGGEHYWPPALLAAARGDAQVAGWLNAEEMPRTEELPPALQSRWVDASELPSKPLAVEQIKTAARAEAAEFRMLFGREPVVAVPPTFVWDDAVESGWAEAGVQFVVTPGRRYGARTEAGEVGNAGPEIRNGEKGAASITYVVRDEYFEPARGHTAERARDALAAKTRLGRPTLLETHRANFIGNAAEAESAFRKLDQLLDLVLKAYPATAFLSTEELASRMRRSDRWLVEHAVALRIQVWLRRLWNVDRLRKLAWVTGAIIPGWILYAVSRAAAPRASAI